MHPKKKSFSKSVQHPSAPPAHPPLRPSESLTTGLFLAALDGGLARCAGEAGPVGMSCCSLSSAVRWTPGLPILIRFAAAAICPSSMINPGCYLAPAGHTVNTVCVCLQGCVYFTRRFSGGSVETSKMLEILQVWVFLCVRSV